MPEVPDLTTDLQPTAQEDAPVIIDRRPQTVAVDPNKLNVTPQVVDGRVRVSDDISAQAEEQGYAADIQPRAAAPGLAVTTGVGDSLGGQMVTSVLPDTSAGQIQGLRAAGKDDEADEIVEKAAAAQVAFAAITSPLSVKTEVLAERLVDAGEDAVPVAEPIPDVEIPSAAELNEQSTGMVATEVPDITKAPESTGSVPLEDQGDATVLGQPNPDPVESGPIVQTDPTAPGNPDAPGPTLNPNAPDATQPLDPDGNPVPPPDA